MAKAAVGTVEASNGKAVVAAKTTVSFEVSAETMSAFQRCKTMAKTPEGVVPVSAGDLAKLIFIEWVRKSTPME